MARIDTDIVGRAKSGRDANSVTKQGGQSEVQRWNAADDNSGWPAPQPASNCQDRSVNVSRVTASYNNPASPGLPGDAPPTAATCCPGVYLIYSSSGTAPPQTYPVYTTFSCPSSSNAAVASSHTTLSTFLIIMVAAAITVL